MWEHSWTNLRLLIEHGTCSIKLSCFLLPFLFWKNFVTLLYYCTLSLKTSLEKVHQSKYSNNVNIYIYKVNFFISDFENYLHTGKSSCYNSCKATDIQRYHTQNTKTLVFVNEWCHICRYRIIFKYKYYSDYNSF